MENKEKKNNKNGKKAVLWVLLAIAVVLVAAVLMRSCGSSSSEEPEESTEPTEAVDDEAGKNATETSTKATAKPKTSAEPDETEEPDASAEPSATASPTSTTKPTSSTSNPTSTAEPEESAEPTETPHVHSWQAVWVTVHHEETGHWETVVTQEAYEEPVYETVNVCWFCGQDISGSPASHMAIHIANGEEGAGGYYADRRQIGTVHHDAVTEQKWVVDNTEYDEQVISYYICACGKTKDAD